MYKDKLSSSKGYNKYKFLLKETRKPDSYNIFLDANPLKSADFFNIEAEDKLEFIDNFFLWIVQERIYLLKYLDDKHDDYVLLSLDAFLGEILESEVAIIKNLIDIGYSELKIHRYLEKADSHLPVEVEMENFKPLYPHFRFIKKQLTIYERISNEIRFDYSNNLISLDSVSHKVLLYDEIGIIDHVKSKYKNELNNNSQLAKFLAGLMNINDAAEIHNMSKILSRLGSKSKKKPENKKSIKIIKSELAKFGIDVKKFKSYLD